MKENLEQKIGVLTYNISHRKTYDTLCLLKGKGYKNVYVYAQPLRYQKKFYPQINHRPSISAGMPDTAQICKGFEYLYIDKDIDLEKLPKDMVFLVCGAGILPLEFVKNHILINAHPGYIPLVRGLDAYKWAIQEDKPIGVTTHIIGENIDAGEIIERRIIPVYCNDTFYELAMRVYENEIEMLVDALRHLDEKHDYINPNGNMVYKRMPHQLEEQLLKKFQRYKQKHGISRENKL